MQTLRDLPDIEALEDAGLLSQKTHSFWIAKDIGLSIDSPEEE
jgi:hypothetical protein